MLTTTEVTARNMLCLMHDNAHPHIDKTDTHYLDEVLTALIGHEKPGYGSH